MAEFDRTKQINQLIESIGDKTIKIVTGVRRCGKTYLLKFILPKKLKEKGLIKSTNDVLIVELKSKNNNIKTRKQLLSFLSNTINKNKKFIVIDEVQKIKEYYDVLIDYVQAHPEKELFVTGSNSKIMSTDIVLKFQEYGHEIQLCPLTFKEIKEAIPDYSIDDYLRYGGLPLIVNEKPEKREEELNRIYSELYEGDIKDRIKNKFTYISKSKIRQILKAVFSTTSEISIHKIASRFAKGSDPSTFDSLKLKAEIEETMQVLLDSLLLQEFENDSFNGLDILKNIGLNKKYYCVDNGLLYINCEDYGRIDAIVFENAIYLYLKEKKLNPRGKIILDGNKKVGEIDFNYTLDNRDYHVQATYEYHDGDYDREVGNLLLFKDGSNKVLVYRFDLATIERNNDIEYIDCEKYLLSQ